MRANRAVSPVISVILMVAIVVVLVATASVFIFDSGLGVDEPAPFVADTTGEFDPEGDGNPYTEDNQIVRITHRGGDSVAVEDIEIIVRASGPSLDTEAQLVDLPSDDGSSAQIDNNDIDGNVDLISESNSGDLNKIIDREGSNTWSAGDTVQFRIATGEADFREGESPAADTLEVIIVHTPSDVIISENTFTP